MFKRTLLAALASVALFAACDKEKEKSATQDIRAPRQRKHHDYRQKQG